MKHILKLYVATALLCWLGLVNITPAQAGDPDKTVGPGDPTHLVCVEKNSHLFVDLDSDAFSYSGVHNPNIEVDPERVKRDCKEAEKLFKSNGYQVEFVVEYARQTRIEGFVFEFHPDPSAPGGWLAVPSQSVPVVASGPGFEVFWGSEKDGSFYFNNLGEGPVTFNLRLPPDAHPINPNITIMSGGFKKTWQVQLAFYRGDVPPDDFESLRLPLGFASNALIPGDTIIDIDENGAYSYMPNVGGILSPNRPVSILILAGMILITLPTVGFIALRRKRAED